MSRPSSAGIAVPAYIDTGRSGRFGRPPAPTLGSPSTSSDVTASQLMQQTMGSRVGEEIPEDSLDPLGEEIVRDDAVLRRVIKDVINQPKANQTSLGLFIPVPDDIARHIERDFPILRTVAIHDDSPPHITLLYIGNLSSDISGIKSIISAVSKRHKPFRVHLRGTDYFDHDDKSVLFIHAMSPELDDLHDDMVTSFGECGHEIEHNQFDEYVGHMTLQYLPPMSRIHHICMEHTWIVDRFELWGAGSPIMFRLGEITPMSESSLLDEDEDEEEGDISTEVSAVSAVAGYTLPLGMKSKAGNAPSWKHAARAFGKAKLAK